MNLFEKIKNFFRSNKCNNFSKKVNNNGKIVDCTKENNEYNGGNKKITKKRVTKKKSTTRK